MLKRQLDIGYRVSEGARVADNISQAAPRINPLDHSAKQRAVSQLIAEQVRPLSDVSGDARDIKA